MPELIESQVARKIKRLSAMGFHELAHRAREKTYIELDRVGAGRDIGERSAADALPFKEYLTRGLSRRFCRSHREDLRAFVAESFQEWIPQAINEAESSAGTR